MPCFFPKKKTLKAPPSRKLPHLFQLQLFCIFTSRWQRAGTWIFIREEAASHKKNAKKENKPWWHLSTGLRVFLFGLFGNAHYLLQGLCFCFISDEVLLSGMMSADVGGNICAAAPRRHECLNPAARKGHVTATHSVIRRAESFFPRSYKTIPLLLLHLIFLFYCIPMRKLQ